MNKEDLVFYQVRINKKLLKIFKEIIKKTKMSQQDFFDSTIKEFIVKNIDVVAKIEDK